MVLRGRELDEGEADVAHIDLALGAPARLPGSPEGGYEQPREETDQKDDGEQVEDPERQPAVCHRGGPCFGRMTKRLARGGEIAFTRSPRSAVCRGRAARHSTRSRVRPRSRRRRADTA